MVTSEQASKYQMIAAEVADGVYPAPDFEDARMSRYTQIGFGWAKKIILEALTNPDLQLPASLDPDQYQDFRIAQGVKAALEFYIPAADVAVTTGDVDG